MGILRLMPAIRRMALPLYAVLHGVWGPVSAGAANRTFDPALFRQWARGSVNIMETYSDYKAEYRELRPKRYDSASAALVDRSGAFFLMFDFAAFLPSFRTDSLTNAVDLQSSEGILHGYMQKSYATLHLSYRTDIWEYGGYLILDALDLYMDKAENPDKPHLFEGYEEDDSPEFSAGYYISAGYLRLLDMEINFGSLYRTLPITRRDSVSGKEVFHLIRGNGGRYEGTETSEALFLDLRMRGYSVNTLYSLKEKFEFVGLGLADFKWRDYTAAPFLRYSRYRTRIQAGAEVRRSFSDRWGMELEAAGDLHRNRAGDMRPYGHAILGNRWSFFHLPRSRRSEFRRYDFRCLLDYDFSVSTDAVEAPVIGQTASVTVKEILGFLNLRFGMGYNDYRYLSLFPLKDTFAADLLIRVAW